MVRKLTISVKSYVLRIIPSIDVLTYGNILTTIINHMTQYPKDVISIIHVYIHARIYIYFF